MRGGAKKKIHRQGDISRFFSSSKKGKISLIQLNTIIQYSPPIYALTAATSALARTTVTSRPSVIPETQESVQRVHVDVHHATSQSSPLPTRPWRALSEVTDFPKIGLVYLISIWSYYRYQCVSEILYKSMRREERSQKCKYQSKIH